MSSHSGAARHAAGRSTLGPRYFRLLSAAAISFAGDGLRFTAIPLIAAGLTTDPRLIASVSVASGVGWLLVGLVAGVLVDRWSRVSVMWAVDTVRAVLTGVLAALIVLHLNTIWTLVVVGLLLGLVEPFFDSAAAAVVPELVDEKGLVRANGWIQGSEQLLGNLVGPPLGALLVVAAAWLPVALDAVSFALAAVLVFSLRRHVVRRPPSPERHLRRELVQGLRVTWGDPALRGMMLLSGVSNLVVTGLVSVLVLFVLTTLHLSRTTYGWLVAGYAVGGLLAAALVPRLPDRMSRGIALPAAAVVASVTVISIGVWSEPVPVAVAIVLLGFSGVWWAVLAISLRQRIVSGEVMGRVMSVNNMFSAVARLVGAAAVGVVAAATSFRLAYVALGVLWLVCTVLVAPGIRRGVKAYEARTDAATGSDSGDGGDGGVAAGTEEKTVVWRDPDASPPASNDSVAMDDGIDMTDGVALTGDGAPPTGPASARLTQKPTDAEPPRRNPFILDDDVDAADSDPDLDPDWPSVRR